MFALEIPYEEFQATYFLYIMYCQIWKKYLNIFLWINIHYIKLHSEKQYDATKLKYRNLITTQK